jgi:hypothetical protein
MASKKISDSWSTKSIAEVAPVAPTCRIKRSASRTKKRPGTKIWPGLTISLRTNPGRTIQVGGTGPEQPTPKAGNPDNSGRWGGKKGGLLPSDPTTAEKLEADPGFRELAELWSSLSERGREELLRLLRNVSRAPSAVKGLPVARP